MNSSTRIRLAAVAGAAALAAGALAGCGSSSSTDTGGSVSTSADGGATLTYADGGTYTVTLANGATEPIDIYGNSGQGPVSIYNGGSGEIAATLGQPFAVGLAQSPSTGYQWKATGGTAPGTVVELVQDWVGVDDPGTPGTNGTHYWVYKASAGGSGTLTFSEYPPGSSKASKTETFTVTVGK